MRRLLFIFFMLTGLFCHAQVSQDLRREFTEAEDLDDINVALFGEKGLVAFGDESLKGSSGKRYTFYKLDKALKTMGMATIDLPKQFHIQEFKAVGGELIVLFLTRRGDVWHLTVLNFDNLKITNFNGNLKRRIAFQVMEVCGDHIYVANVIRKKPNLLIINKQTGKSRSYALSSQQGGKPWIVNLEADPISGSTFLYLGYYMTRKHTGVDVLVYNEDGYKKATYVLSGIKDNNLTEISATRLGPEHYLLVGTYSKFSAEQGEGFFVAEIKEGVRSYLKYYNYLDLKGFTSFFSANKQTRIDKKKERKKARGKELSMSLLMTPHQIKLNNDQYFFLGEFYYPTYYTEIRTQTVNGQLQTTTFRTFDGYQYTHAIIGCFDHEGNLLWNSPFEMWLDFKPMKIHQFVTFSVSPEGRVDLMFTSRKSVFFKSLDAEGKVINDRSFSGIETGKDTDKLLQSVSMMDHWYDNHFIAYGSQSIKDKGNTSGKKKRKVLFINMISID